MTGLGTLINALAIVVGGLIGLLLGSRLTRRYQESLMVVTGVCVLVIGVAGTIEQVNHPCLKAEACKGGIRKQSLID